MGLFDFMKGKGEKSKGQTIVDAFKQKHEKNIEPFANEEERKAAFDNLVNSAHEHFNTAIFSNKPYVTTLMEDVKDYVNRAMPKLKKYSKVYKKVTSSIAIVVLATALSSCGTNMECLYCKEHNINHDHYKDSYENVSQGEPTWGDNVYVDPDLDWVGGNNYPGNNGIISEPSDDKGHDYGNKEDNDVTIEDNDKVQKEDNVVGNNGAVVEGNNNETIVVNGNVYYIYNENNQVINVGNVNNPQGLTQEQLDKLMEILKELKDKGSKDDKPSAPEKEPEDQDNQGSNGNQGNENVGDNGNQGAPEDMNAVDKFVCDYIQSKEPVKVTRMYAEKPVADGMTNTENIGKTVDVIFELSNNESVRISCEINLFNQFEKGQGFVYDRNKITSDNERIARIVKEMIELFENSYTA